MKRILISGVGIFIICFVVGMLLMGKHGEIQNKVYDNGQSNQTSYTKINYQDGYYYFPSSADHFYLYKFNETGTKMECLAKQVPKEVYAAGEWIYFTNVSDGQTLYRVHVDGSGMEQVMQMEISRFVMMDDGVYYLAESDGCIYEWREGTGSRLLYEGNCRWLSTDGKILYILVEEKEEGDTAILMDKRGNILSQYDGCRGRILSMEQCLYYVENRDLICISSENGKRRKMTEIPFEMEYEDVIDYGICEEVIYVLCYQPEETYVIYQYDMTEDIWRTLYKQPLEDSDWMYMGFDDFQIVGKKIFIKEFSEEGKGELWFWIDIDMGEKGTFEDMEPLKIISTSNDDVLCQAVPESLSYLDEDYVFEKSLEDGEGNIINFDMVMPHVNENIKAYHEINQKIQKDAEEFYNEQMEFSEYIKDAADEWENESAGCWKYVYAYADADYVSIVYWKFIGRNGLNDVKCDKYEARLYSSSTGEELEVTDLFTANQEEVLLRFSYAIRKTKSGLRLFYDDFEMLERHDLDDPSRKSYYLLTGEGIDVFFVERVRTKVNHYIIKYDELQDILR